MELRIQERPRSMESFRALMRASGLEPRLVSGMMGYPYPRFRAILSGEIPVTDEFVQRAEEALGVPEAIFATEESKIPAPVR